MPAGLFLPLQLAANLLALGAAAGFGVVVLLRVGSVEPGDASRRSGLADALLVAGSVALVAGHAIEGALVPDAAEVVGWLLAGGLVLIALGAAPSRLPDPAAVREPVEPTSVAAVAVAMPALTGLPSPSAAVVGAAGGTVAAVRLAVGGRATILVALAVALWGAASGLRAFDQNLALLCTIGGSVALAAWIWQVSASQLRAKIVVAFLITLLALVAGLATVLSAGGANDLLAEEELTLQSFAREVANELTTTLPERSRLDAQPLRQASRVVDGLVANDDVEGLASVLRDLTTQDVLAILDLDGGEVVIAARRSEDVPRDLGVRLEASPVATELLEGATEAEGVARFGGQLIAVGGGHVAAEPSEVDDPDGPDADAPAARYAVLGAKIVDREWLEAEAASLPFGVALEIGDELEPSAGVPPVVLERLRGRGPDRTTLEMGDDTLIVGAEPVADPLTGAHLGRVVTSRAGGAVAELQRDQARQLFVLALLGALIAAAVAGVVAGRLLAPVKRLTAAAAAVGRGRLDTTVAVDSPDEIGTLGRTFDQMTQSLAGQARQLREAADEQARLRARLEALTASMSDGLIATDEDGRVLTFNPAAAQLTGQEPADVEGRPLDDALTLSGDQPATETLGDVRSEDVRAARVLVVGAGDEPVPTDITAAPVRDSEGRTVGRVLVLRDVTREAEIERMKTEFLSNVSHELRTPLTPIRGFADVLNRRDVPADEVQRYAGQIVSSAERLERVVTRIVDFAALDSGRMQAQIEGCDLGELVDEVLGAWRRRLPQRQFRRRLARQLPPVETDHSMLTRCLDELVDNAVKFSGEDDPVIVTAAPDDGAVRLTVRDRGVGFPPERAAAVFGDFYQVDASETRHFDGLGLGLALVRRLVDALGGDATVESAPGEGAAFHLWLPVVGAGSTDGERAAATG